MEATALVEKVKRISSNQYAVTFSVSISSFHLKLLDKNNKETDHKDKATYTFVLTVLDHKFHMDPEDALGECMEIRDNHETCKGLTPYQQRQWCVAELTHRVVNHLISTDLMKPVFLVDIPMWDVEDEFEIDDGEETPSPIGAIRKRLRDIESDIENLIDLLNGMRAVSDISKTKTRRGKFIDETLKRISSFENE
ncbi:MAG: hypothetical protein DSY91_00500 [Deltaproteobacteria bacterium]|nr:MAG: hypothetical protein DSY91_00500 [Deltaproteobacteria bacterium]